MKARRTIEDFRRDIAERRSTPGDEERKQNVLNHGRECLRRVKGDTTWEDWMGIGAALMVITEEAMKTVGVTAWNKDNKHLIREFNERWDEYEASALEQGSNQKPLSKQERWALREVMTNPEIGAWRSGLDGTNRRKLNHPNKVIERWRRATQTSDKEPRKPSPSLSQALKDRDKVIAELEARNTELEEELAAAPERIAELEEERKSGPAPLTVEQHIAALITLLADASEDERRRVFEDIAKRLGLPLINVGKQMAKDLAQMQKRQGRKETPPVEKPAKTKRKRGIKTIERDVGLGIKVRMPIATEE